jgi:tRNA-2-methylthio-N6-dimethylallyladenosine synthase
MFEIEKKVIEEDKQGQPTLVAVEIPAGAKRLYLESYGCQMNFSDSEIVASIMLENGYYTTSNLYESDVIMINTCAIRENAEQKVRKRLTEFRKLKKSKPALIVGVLGCMAERLKEKFLEEEKLVDVVVGPDAYRSLPALVGEVEGGQKAMNVLLSLEETYADISPVRLGGNGITAFISIMRGCDNMCSFCVVPFTRGRERSRNPESIMQEARELWDAGYKEITLLGQNVDSYLWYGGGAKKEFKTLTDEEKATAINFAQLLEMVAHIHPDLRIRYTTSNPRDMTDEVLQVMARYDNICKYIHLPVQSGNTAVLERMNRGYSREEYLNRVDAIKKYMPDCAISTDIICGFCGETDQEHEDTKSLMLEVGFDYAYMFNYSERPKTLAERKYSDDIPEDLKTKRLEEVIAIQRKLSLESNLKDVGKTFRVLVEGTSKRNENELFGRNSQNKVIIFPKENLQPGDYAWVNVHDCNSATLLGKVGEREEARS